MRPEDNPHIHSTRAAEAQRAHDRYQARIDAQYAYKPSPQPRTQQTTFYNPSVTSSPRFNPGGGASRRSSMSPKTAVTVVGLIVGGVAAAYASSHGVKSTLGLACAFGIPAGLVVALLRKLTRS